MIRSKIKNIPIMSPKELLDYCIVAPRPFEYALYSLPIGELGLCRDKTVNSDNSTYQNQYRATILASDTLLRTSMNKPCEFQLIFGEYLQRQKTSRQFKDHYSAFQLTPWRTFSIKARYKKDMKRLDKGLNIQPHDLPIVLIDNVGFKQLRYDQ